MRKKTVPEPPIPALHPLAFASLRAVNLARSLSRTPYDWGTAAAGEIGAALGLVKQLQRGETVAREAIAAELADAVICLDLLSARLDIDLGAAIAHSFNRTAERRKAPQRLEPDPGAPPSQGVEP